MSEICFAQELSKRFRQRLAQVPRKRNLFTRWKLFDFMTAFANNKTVSRCVIVGRFDIKNYFVFHFLLLISTEAGAGRLRPLSIRQ